MPQRQSWVLIVIFLSTLITVFFLKQIDLFPESYTGIVFPRTTMGWVYVVLFYCTLLLAYIIHYLAIEWDSPSMLIVLRIAQAREKGLTKEEIEFIFSNNEAILSRIDNLVLEKMIFLKGDLYHTTPYGNFLFNIFNEYRRLVGFRGEIV